MVLAWIVLGIVLLLFELHHLAFFALFVAIGSLAAAATAAIAPDAYAVQAGVAAAVSIAGVGAVRPTLRAAYERHHRGGHVARGVHGGLVGQEAVTLDTVGDAHAAGHARFVGERWLAVSEGGEAIPPGTTVIVTAVRGTTLVVLPVSTLRLPAERSIDPPEDEP